MLRVFRNIQIEYNTAASSPGDGGTVVGGSGLLCELVIVNSEMVNFAELGGLLFILLYWEKKVKILSYSLIPLLFSFHLKIHPEKNSVLNKLM